MDEGAPAPAAEPFKKAGHSVIEFGEILASGSRDRVVADGAIANNAVLLAVDRDMKQMAKRFGSPTDTGRFDGLHILFVCCGPKIAVDRLGQCMTLIEHEWRHACDKKARRFWIEISNHWVKSYR